ncbi:MAG: hypothetical protein V3S39_08645 [Thermodesulfobacteriota bacterium]
MKNQQWSLKTMMTHHNLGFSRKVAKMVYPKLRYAPDVKKMDSRDIKTVTSWLVENGILRHSEAPAVTDVSPPEFSR